MEPPVKKRKIDEEEPLDEAESSNIPIKLELEYKQVPGLRFGSNFLTDQEQQHLLKEIDSLPWSNELSRRVQHYGFRYDYKAKTVPANAEIDPLPPFVDFIVKRLQKCGIFRDFQPDQLIVNGMPFPRNFIFGA